MFEGRVNLDTCFDNVNSLVLKLEQNVVFRIVTYASLHHGLGYSGGQSKMYSQIRTSVRGTYGT